MVAASLPSLVSERLAIERVLGNVIERAVMYLNADRAVGQRRGEGDAKRTLQREEIADNGIERRGEKRAGRRHTAVR